VNAALLGLSRHQAAERFEEIVDFSGIREFIHEPLRVYSAGMSVRLAFSVAVASDPDVLLIDEVLGVGDEAFYAKCLDKIKSFRAAGKTILLASHSIELVNMLCHRAIWLERGQVMRQGTAKEVSDAYRASVVS
jgi:ABC-type polysaccharide/polyol phosphate transport system ATPase subunit